MADKNFHISRETTIAAPPERIHALVNDFHEWQAWSPWEGLDPAMERTYAGPTSGVGAVYAWRGNSKAEIWFSEDANRIMVKLKADLPVGSLNLYLTSARPPTISIPSPTPPP